MKLNKLIFIHAFIVLVAVATGCKQEPGETFELKGKLDGISEGTIILTGTKDDYDKSDTVSIKDGEFLFTGDIPMPGLYILKNGRERVSGVFLC